MTNPEPTGITCEQFNDELPDLLERDADEATRARLEAHAAGCAECGALLADLRKLRVDAGYLPSLSPSRDLWSGIAARIETPVVEIMPGRGTVERWSGGAVERSSDTAEPHRRRLAPLWMGLAAAALVAITATITHQITQSTMEVHTPTAPDKSAPVVAPTVAAAPTTVAAPRDSGSLDSAQSPERPSASASVRLAGNKPTAEETYDAEIKRLRVIVSARRSSLDSVTVAVIEKNLNVIDEAIAQCRAALQRDPASGFLLESLNDALDRKVQLLRTAAMLPSRS
jgi:hypothetical protein